MPSDIDEDQYGDYVTPDGIPRSAHVEDIGRYVAGGYHPVHIGDLLDPDERFEVHHKLGHSATCTVWLCLDQRDKRRVAVKILKASESSDSHPEITALRLFDGIDRQELRANRIFLMEDHFWIDGPNGRHICFVMPVLGPPISCSLKGMDFDTPDFLTDLCFQASLGLKYLHDKGIVHGGFQPDHMRLQLDLDRMSEVKIYDLLGEPKLWYPNAPDEANISSYRPKYLVAAVSIADLEADYRTGEIAIESFASAHREGEGEKTKATEPAEHDTSYAAPETRFLGISSDFSSDIWSLGSTIHLVRTNKLLLAWLPSSCSIVAWLAWAYGPFPQEMWTSIGQFLLKDGAVPLFSPNVIKQISPGSLPRRKPNDASRGDEHPVDWGENRNEVIALLLGEAESYRTISLRHDIMEKGDRSAYPRVKLPLNGLVWSKFQDQRRRITGFTSLLHEDLGKERQWYHMTEPPSEDEGFDKPDVHPRSIDEALRQRLNSTWDLNIGIQPAEQAQEQADSHEGETDADPDAPGKGKRKRLVTEDVGPKPKKARKFVAEHNTRDFVERVDQPDGVTKVSYCLKAEEVALLGDLLSKMLKNDAKERISIDEVLQHEWFERSRKARETA